MQVLHLTTVGRRTGLPREIEIWFVVWRERLYLFAETGEAAGWVKNIRSNPKVTVRIGEWQLAQRHVCSTVTPIGNCGTRSLKSPIAKYGWGDGLPVEITPLPLRATDSDTTIEPTERG